MAICDETVSVMVTFVEPSSADPGGCRRIGTYPMAAVPRRGETVVMRPAFRGEMARYRVRELIHHMPDPGIPDVSAGVMVFVTPVLTRNDRERALLTLCCPHVAAETHPETAQMRG